MAGLIPWLFVLGSHQQCESGGCKHNAMVLSGYRAEFCSSRTCLPEDLRSRMSVLQQVTSP